MPSRYPAPEGSRTILVWDLFVRIFHWSLALSVFTAFFFTEAGEKPHEIAGYLALGLVCARVIWGITGTRYTRFSQFVPGPKALLAYLAAMAKRRETRFIGHNPAGAIMVLALLAAVLAASISGWMLTTETYFGEAWVEVLHKTVSNALMSLVGLHVGGVLYTSWRHAENLVRAMITGRKPS
ncbi:MAG: cytochrome B [Betaproteobacteria bacterium]|nr:cytochrome B [Betaproteobacteria bacterium]